VRDGCQRTRRPEGRARRREPAVRGYKRAERVTREFDPSALVGRASTMSAPPAFFLTFSAASCAFDFDAKDSPELATVWPFAATSRHL